MGRLAFVAFASVAALAAACAVGAQAAPSPGAGVCARSWNRSATFAEKASVARLRPRTAWVLARTRTGVPECLVYFGTTKGVLLARAARTASAVRWTAPRRCPSPPAGILARVDARGFVSLLE